MLRLRLILFGLVLFFSFKLHSSECLESEEKKAITVAFDYQHPSISDQENTLLLDPKIIRTDQEKMINFSAKGLNLRDKQIVLINDTFLKDYIKSEDTPRARFLSALEQGKKGQSKDQRYSFMYSGHGIICHCIIEGPDKDLCIQSTFENYNVPQFPLNAKSEMRWCVIVPGDEEDFKVRSDLLKNSSDPKVHQRFLKSMQRTFVSDKEIQRRLVGLDSMYLDACHAGAACNLESRTEQNNSLPLTIFASVVAPRTTILQKGVTSSPLWFMLDEMAKSTSRQCELDLDRNGIISEREVALGFTLNSFQCSLRSYLTQQEGEILNADQAMRKLAPNLSLPTASSRNGLEQTSPLLAPVDPDNESFNIPQFTVSNRCFKKLPDPLVCPSARPKPYSNSNMCLEAKLALDNFVINTSAIMGKKLTQVSCPQVYQATATSTGATESEVDQRLLLINNLWKTSINSFKFSTAHCPMIDDLQPMRTCSTLSSSLQALRKLEQDLDLMLYWIGSQHRVEE